MLKTLLTCILCMIAIQTLAQDLQHQAQAEYKRCLRETKQARDECSFGGCGNILGSCYEREVNLINSQIAKQVQQFKTETCKADAQLMADEFEGLKERLWRINALDNTWDGMQLKVDLALLHHKTLQALVDTCVKRQSTAAGAR